MEPLHCLLLARSKQSGTTLGGSNRAPAAARLWISFSEAILPLFSPISMVNRELFFLFPDWSISFLGLERPQPADVGVRSYTQIANEQFTAMSLVIVFVDLDQCVVGGLKVALRNGIAHELR